MCGGGLRLPERCQRPWIEPCCCEDATSYLARYNFPIGYEIFRWTNRKMIEDLKRKLLIVMAVLLLLSSAQGGNTDRISGHHCTDFQTAYFLRGSKLKVQFLLFTSSSPTCGELILADDGIKNSSFNSSLETKIIIHGFSPLQVLKGCYKVSTEPSLLQAEQPQLSQPVLIGEVLQPSDHFCGPPVDLLQNVHVLPVLRPPELDAVLQMRKRRSERLGDLTKDFLPVGSRAGSRALGTKPSWIEGLVHAILHTSQVNVIAVDWVYGSTGAYPSAVENVTELALFISQFISKLLALGVSATSIHIIGVSLGAHVGGLVGHFHGGQLGRITGLLEQAGVNMKNLPKEVKVYLMTSPSAPFCVHHSLVEFHLQKKRNVVTSIEITFFSNSTEDKAKITIPKHHVMGKRLLAHRVPPCQINSVTLKYLPKNQFWRKDDTFIVGKFCTAPLPLDNK
ncbi:phospholipase a1 member hypothetical protein [Limosa lapponica baueri]|uniref:Phospholipase A1 member A n=1 Tax=Limosa lapponica baueri TaxID=1758121 RepID=A0A2I0TYG7_LIMLA|nr:phospholipase a1 member hypothetical protein [Limosa lapponica baueri]